MRVGCLGSDIVGVTVGICTVFTCFVVKELDVSVFMAVMVTGRVG